jgi:hypothetical protein
VQLGVLVFVSTVEAEPEILLVGEAVMGVA